MLDQLGYFWSILGGLDCFWAFWSSIWGQNPTWHDCQQQLFWTLLLCIVFTQSFKIPRVFQKICRITPPPPMHTTIARGHTTAPQHIHRCTEEDGWGGTLTGISSSIKTQTKRKGILKVLKGWKNRHMGWCFTTEKRRRTFFGGGCNLLSTLIHKIETFQWKNETNKTWAHNDVHIGGCFQNAEPTPKKRWNLNSLKNPKEKKT